MASLGRAFLLWDASAVITYYLGTTATTPRAAARIRMVVDAGRNHRIDALFLIPNIVVAEVFVALDRNHYSTWDKVVNKKFGGPGRSLHGSTYRLARSKFRGDIHNGALFYQHDLNRYHVLGLDLISPVDKYRKFYRKGPVMSMGASDLLIGSMAMHLARTHGRARVALVTTDRRMEAIFARACPQLNANTAKGLGLVAAASRLGFGDWRAAIYPKVIDIARCTDGDLAAFFGSWPLKTRKLRGRAPKA